jgi:hypothetical protein
VHLTCPRRKPRVPAPPLALVALCAAAAISLAACGSSSATSAAARNGTALQQQCTSVAAVLSDGPDPTADPVGYAEAQVRPLRQLQITDTALRRAVQLLATAYQTYSTTAGAAGIAAAVQASKAEAAVNAICPGAAN